MLWFQLRQIACRNNACRQSEHRNSHKRGHNGNDFADARRRANIPIADRCQRDGRPIDRIQKACEGIRLNLKQYQRRQKDIPNCQKPYREKVILSL